MAGAGGTAGAGGGNAGRGGAGGAAGGQGGSGGASGGRGGTGGGPCGMVGQMCCAGGICNSGVCIDLGGGTICGISALGGRGGQSGGGGAGGNSFSCGSSSCEVDAQFCLQASGGIPSIPPTYTCLPVPSACLPTPTCSCLQSQGIAGAATCAEVSPGALRVTLAAP
jgi:hypothetical protein